jgi:hypothetical protein
MTTRSFTLHVDRVLKPVVAAAIRRPSATPQAIRGTAWMPWCGWDADGGPV